MNSKKVEALSETISDFSERPVLIGKAAEAMRLKNRILG